MEIVDRVELSIAVTLRSRSIMRTTPPFFVCLSNRLAPLTHRVALLVFRVVAAILPAPGLHGSRLRAGRLGVHRLPRDFLRWLVTTRNMIAEPPRLRVADHRHAKFKRCG